MRAIYGAIGLSTLALAAMAGRANAANYTIDWLNMSPVPLNTSVPNSSVFNLPGVGNVTVVYSTPPPITNARAQNPSLLAGNLTSGGNNYAWTNHEMFSTIFTVGPDPLVPLQWRITYFFPSTLPANSIYVGVAGLGQTTSFGGGATIATVNQNGTFLGDWSGAGGPWGPTQYTGGVGTFSMQNSMNGAGGADPWWNTPLGVVQINDPVSSLTIDVSQIRGDGIGVNIGYVPAPGACALLGLGGLVVSRRRR
jgi:hypothetical protein